MLTNLGGPFFYLKKAIDESSTNSVYFVRSFLHELYTSTIQFKSIFRLDIQKGQSLTQQGCLA